MTIMYGAVQSWCCHLCSSRPPFLNEGKKIPESWFAAAPGWFSRWISRHLPPVHFISNSGTSIPGCHSLDVIGSRRRCHPQKMVCKILQEHISIILTPTLTTVIRLCWHVPTQSHLATEEPMHVITIIWGQIYLPDAKYISLKPNICTWGLGKRCASSSGESYLLPLPIGTGSLRSGWDEIWGVT